MKPDNLKKYPVFIHAKDGRIYLVKELGRKETNDPQKATVRVFRPAGIFSEDDFVEGIKRMDPRFLSESFASTLQPEKKSIFELWDKRYYRMVVEEVDKGKYLAFYGDRKGEIKKNYETMNIHAKYMKLNEDSGRYRVDSDWYDVGSARANAKNWILLEAQFDGEK